MKDGKHVILCVDDDNDVRDFMKLVLEPEGYQVVLARDEDDGFAAYQREEPDLLILDCMMESSDAGLKLARRIRDDGCTAPLFMLSSIGDDLALTTDTADYGLAGVIQKPIEIEFLLKLLKTKLQ